MFKYLFENKTVFVSNVCDINVKKTLRFEANYLNYLKPVLNFMGSSFRNIIKDN